MSFPVMIFAAGFGTRMKHLTRDKPKPMVNVAGRPLIDHAIDLAKDAGATTLVANLHYKADMLDRHLSGTGVITRVERPQILDTGGGLRNALDLLGDGPVVTLNSDAIWKGKNPLEGLAQAWDPDKMDALLMTIPLANAIGYQGEGNFVISPTGTATRGPGAVYSGAQIIKPDLLHDIADNVFSLNRIWDMMIEKNSLYAIEYNGFWCDVGHPEGIDLAENLLRSNDV